MSSAVCDAVTTVFARRLAPASASDVVDRRRTSSPAGAEPGSATRSPPARPATAARPRLRACWPCVRCAPPRGSRRCCASPTVRASSSPRNACQDLADAFGLVAGALEVLRHALGRLAELLACLADGLRNRLRVNVGQALAERPRQLHAQDRLRRVRLLRAMPPAIPTAAAPTAAAGAAALPATLLTVSATPFPLRLLDVERLDPLLELRLAALRFDAVLALRLVGAALRRGAPAAARRAALRRGTTRCASIRCRPRWTRLLEDRAVVFADGLRAVDFLEVVDRFVLLRGVLPAIAFSSIWRPAACRLPYPNRAPKTQRAKNCSTSMSRLRSG